MKALRQLLAGLRDTLVSLHLTVALLILSIALVLAATLDQVNLGVWAIQDKYIRSLFVLWPVGDARVPIFPGGYLLGGLLLANLVAALVWRFTFAWRKSGILLTHAGLILLLLGELISGLWQEEFQLRLDEGQTRSYSESYHLDELAVVDVTDPQYDEVVAIPAALLAGKKSLQHPRLPFRIETRTFFANSAVAMRAASAPAAPGGPAATRGVGPQLSVREEPVTYKPDARNLPSAFVELIGPEGSLGTWMVSVHLLEPQRFEYGGRTWQLALRPERRYKPFALTLLKFSHDRYPGTEIPRNFSSRLRLVTADGRDDREVLISMNNPLRYGGLTFYQAGFANDDRTSVLQVVRNPGWLMPYLASGLMGLGLVVQFGLRLVPTRGRRAAAGLAGPAGGGTTAPPPRRPALERAAPWLALSLGLALIGASLRPPSNPGPFDLAAFGRLPVLGDGRIKPLDTVARTSLLVLQGRQRVVAPDGRTLPPAEWLLEVFFRPEAADTLQTFEVLHPDLLALFKLEPAQGAGGKRFSFHQLAPGLAELDRQARLADPVETAVRTPFQKAVVQLRNNLVRYQRLQAALAPPEVDEFLTAFAEWQQGSRPAGTAAARLGLQFALMEQTALLHPLPAGDGGWTNAGAAWRAALADGKVPPAAAAYAGLAQAWRTQHAASFNAHLETLRSDPALAGLAPPLRSRLEVGFNAAEPFYTSALLYVLALLLGAGSWLAWPEALGRAARWLLALAFVLTTAGIAARMWLEGRPPVTNLYSSALFVGWGSVGLCLLLERFARNGAGSVAGGAIGFGTLVIAHHLALGGDTLEMMRAVLDSNFWLATHVVVITIGYSAMFLAGFLAVIYVLRGLLTRTLDAAAAAGLARMVYGVVCFATLFSLAGTVLGGIWADQSWGRFWGWDPKENGALIIVLWCAVILHARWGALVRERGLMALAIAGNIVTAWSWFGVNMLGVGLHSYGFMDAAFWWLAAFMLGQLALIAATCLPPAWWRSLPVVLLAEPQSQASRG